MPKLNWSCNICGMSAGRRTSVQRHIDNPNIHNGHGVAVPFAEYSTGSSYRHHAPRPAAQDATAVPAEAKPLIIRVEKEVENEIVKEVARRIFQSIPKDDSRFTELENLSKVYIFNKSSKGLAREFSDFD
jgi:hypothetical protein